MEETGPMLVNVNSLHSIKGDEYTTIYSTAIVCTHPEKHFVNQTDKTLNQVGRAKNKPLKQFG